MYTVDKLLPLPTSALNSISHVYKMYICISKMMIRNELLYHLYQENCYYHGHIQDLEDSSVSVTICSGIRYHACSYYKFITRRFSNGNALVFVWMILNSSILSSVHRGFVRLKKQVYLIEPLTNHTDGDHALYKHQHLRWKRSSCGEPKTTIYDHEPPVALPLKSSRGVIRSSSTILANVLHMKEIIYRFETIDISS